MKKTLQALALLLVAHFGLAQGSLIEDEQTSYGEPFEIDVAGFALGNLPDQWDLSPFAPPVMDQQGGTCVGASMYCAMSTLVNSHFNVTSPTHKELMAFDPYFIYTTMNEAEYFPCDLGLMTKDAIESLAYYGTMRDIMSEDFTCDFMWRDPIAGTLVPSAWVNFYAANPFKGFAYSEFKAKKNGKWLQQMKYAISNNLPVIISTEIGDSFDNESNGGTIDESGLWKTDISTNRGGHAMCVIGYDDNNHGGALRIRNSWGIGFGKGGDFWIRYDDFPEITNRCYPLYPQYWWEYYDDNDDAANSIFFELQPTGSPDYDYVRVEGEGGVYEGFVSKTGSAVTGIELYDDGSGYFGLFSDTMKHGIGMYVAADGTRTKCAFERGEQVACPQEFEPKNEFERIVWNKVARLSPHSTSIPKINYAN